MSTRSTLDYLKTETGSGLLLMAAAIVALIWAASPWAWSYQAFTDHVVTLQAGPFRETHTLADWVKEGLMPIFFLVVGLEIKNEIVRGELSNPRRLALPVLAALGGVVVPGLIYVAFNGVSGDAAMGWPIPAATDIAFALAALSVVGSRLPPTLRIFLLTLAIADDLAAVALIAVVYSRQLDLAMLGGAAATLTVLAAMGRWRTAPYFFWAVGFILLWGFTLKSGVSPSLAGVAAAFCVPLAPKRTGTQSVLTELMEALHPYVAFFILPLFALTAAGISFHDLPLEALAGPVSLGVALALFVGKPVGVFGAAAAVIGLKLVRRPTGAKWLELLGVSMLCGIGFTMSLYIVALAFPAGAEHQNAARFGVMAGSLASALAGMALLGFCQMRRGREADG